MEKSGPNWFMVWIHWWKIVGLLYFMGWILSRIKLGQFYLRAEFIHVMRWANLINRLNSFERFDNLTLLKLFHILSSWPISFTHTIHMFTKRFRPKRSGLNLSMYGLNSSIENKWAEFDYGLNSSTEKNRPVKKILLALSHLPRSRFEPRAASEASGSQISAKNPNPLEASRITPPPPSPLPSPWTGSRRPRRPTPARRPAAAPPTASGSSRRRPSPTPPPTRTTTPPRRRRRPPPRRRPHARPPRPPPSDDDDDDSSTPSPPPASTARPVLIRPPAEARVLDRVCRRRGRGCSGRSQARFRFRCRRRRQGGPEGVVHWQHSDQWRV